MRYRLFKQQMFMYFVHKGGISQAAMLCGSVLIPKKIPLEQLQDAANKVFETNDILRERFIEKDGLVYQESVPFERKEFEVLHFNSKEELDRYGEIYGTIPLELEIVSEGNGIPASAWKRGKPSFAMITNMIIHNIKMFFTKLSLGKLNDSPKCCEMILLDLPNASGALFKMHHIISDGWSMMLLTNQFLKFLAGEKVDSFSYFDAIENGKKYRESKRFERDLEYGRKDLAKCSEPTSIWPKKATSMEAVRDTLVLNEELTTKIKKFAGENDLTPYIIFLTSLCIWIKKKKQRDMFYVGATALNRNNYEELNTVGYFATVPPLLVELDSSCTYMDALNYMKIKSMAVTRHRMGLSESNTNTSLMFDLMISYQNATLEADRDAIVTQYYCKFVGEKQIITMEDRLNDNHYKIHFDHNIKISKSEVKELFTGFEKILSKGLENSNTKINELF